LCSICWMTLLRRNRFRLFLHSHGLGMATFSDQETEISKSFNSWWTHTIVSTFLGNLDCSKKRKKRNKCSPSLRKFSQNKKKQTQNTKRPCKALRSDAHGKSAGQNLPFSEPWADIFRMRWRISLGFVMMGIKIRKTKGPKHVYSISLSCQHTRYHHNTPCSHLSACGSISGIDFLKIKTT
jgi:hypothetical protein